MLYLNGGRDDYPPMPDNYLNAQNQAILNEYQTKLAAGEMTIKDFPESLVSATLDNTWHDSTTAIINNWIGCVYQVTHEDIDKPFMDGINPQDPLNLKG
jgi:homoserine O-succinyltransferase